MPDNIYCSGQGLRQENNGSTVNIDLGFSEDVRVWIAQEDETIQLQGSLAPGRRLVVSIKNDNILPHTITFSSDFKSSGPVIGTLLKRAIVTFISDGTFMWEQCRNLGI